MYLLREISNMMMVQFYLNLPWHSIKKKYSKGKIDNLPKEFVVLFVLIV